MADPTQTPPTVPAKHRVGILHAAGYGGGELLRLLLGHPAIEIAGATSRTFAGQPVWTPHPALRGHTSLRFAQALDASDLDAVVIAAEHGQAAAAVARLDEAGYPGAIVDLSADFRFADPAVYQARFGTPHPLPSRLADFFYRIPEIHGDLPSGVRAIANPGCFATAITAALWPIAQHVDAFDAHVTALTGASGSGARPSAGTHFPTRDGNVRGYKVLDHQHVPEIEASLGEGARVHFVPASGPWTRGIWGTAHVALPEGADQATVRGWFDQAYPSGGLIRVWDGLPELRYSVGTPFCDVGVVVRGQTAVVGFGLDNLLKGAASQAVQNLNTLLGLPHTTGLVG
jgi:N-acetyl-gamma-glutamyl-phosphate reductase